MRIALVSREIHPYVGGGIAPIVTEAAKLLSTIADVALFTSARHRDTHLEAATETPYELVWVNEPEHGVSGAYFSHMHHYSARVHRALREHYGARGPDLIEFCDYLAEGFVTVQAKQTLAHWLEDTLVAVRLHTTAEIVNVLNGHVLDDTVTLATYDAERFCLRHADVVLWSGGDVYATYQRFYGRGAIARGVRLPDAFMREGEPEEGSGHVPEDDIPLRMLYLGRMERRKGVHNLLRAVTALERDDWTLTLIGGDTDTGPMGGSIAASLELGAAGDPRISLAPGMTRVGVVEQVRQAHLLVVPSLWECWPNTAREALMLNRPLLATPVGGLVELARPGVSGLQVRDTTPEALQAGIERCLDDRYGLASLIVEGGPRSVFRELTDPEQLVARYERLAGGPSARPARRLRPQPPLVSVVVPYYQLERYVADTLDSVTAQTHQAVELVLVVDGSLREQDAPVIEAARAAGASVVTQVNSGLGPARNFGIAQARGEYVVPLDADDVIAPEFVERCLDVLERDDSLDYVTTWVEYMRPDGTPIVSEDGGWMPFGNWSRLNERNNVAGTCTALFRRAVFDKFAYSPDLTSYEDWLLYLELQDAGRHGGVVPERLLRYRVREESMMRQVGAPSIGRIAGEVHALRRERAMRWTPSLA